MASPHLEVFFVRNPATGNPLTGAAGSLSFATYTDDTGVAVTPVPTISEVGGGLYKFLATLPVSPSRGLTYVISTSGNEPEYVWRFVRPEDWNDDQITDLADVAFGKWVIVNTGPDANRLVLYRQDGVTIVKKFDLRDLTGNPTISNIFQRLPV